MKPSPDTLKVDIENRILCPECPGDDLNCFLCDGTGFVGTLDEIDAEDVEPIHGATSVRRHSRPGRAEDVPPREPIALYVGIAFALGFLVATMMIDHVPAMHVFAKEPEAFVPQIEIIPAEHERLCLRPQKHI